MQKLKNQRRTLTKTLLKNALLQLMKQKDIQKISIIELCSQAGINRTTFYNHYGSQYDVLKDMMFDMSNDLNEVWKTKDENDWTFSKLIEAICIYIADHKEFAKILFKNNCFHFEFAAELFSAADINKYGKRLYSNYEDEYEEMLISTFFTNGIYNMIRQWLLDDIPKTPQEIGSLIYKMAVSNWEMPKKIPN